VWQRALRRGSFGLLGVQERVELIGGQLTIESATGQGTKVRAQFPLSECEIASITEQE
jgi:two-component system sensor histidine kinase DegS